MPKGFKIQVQKEQKASSYSLSVLTQNKVKCEMADSEGFVAWAIGGYHFSSCI